MTLLLCTSDYTFYCVVSSSKTLAAQGLPHWAQNEEILDSIISKTKLGTELFLIGLGLDAQDNVS